MENRPATMAAGLKYLFLLAGFLVLPLSGRTAEGDSAGPTDEQRAEWDSRLAEAKAMQEKGAALKEEAKQVFEARNKECFKKFRVTACQSKAKHQYVEATHEARRIENEGLDRERQVKKEELAQKDARRRAEEPQRQIDLQNREARKREELEHSEASREAKLAEKEEKMRIGEERRAANEERLRKKQEKYERKVAEKMQKAQQREANER